MGELFKLIQKDLMEKLGTNNDDDIVLIQKISEGLSDAEVYKIELSGKCMLKGQYFLKIDENSSEYNKSGSIKHFDRFVDCVYKLKSNSYYVLLIEIAGSSSYEYSSFYSVKSPKKQREITLKIILEILTKLTAKNTTIGEKCKPVEIFRQHLAHKLDDRSLLHCYLQERFGIESSDRYFCIKIGDQIYPDPFAYARRRELWENLEVRHTRCTVHGDFHGDNIFVSQNTYEYALIDLSHCDNNGYLFFDNAYLELSLLLRDFNNSSLNEWAETIVQISNNKFEDLNFGKIEAVQSIKDTEMRWIKDINQNGYSHTDAMKVCQRLSRVLVGLNYAGKSKVTEDIRIKSFVFAAIYLKDFFNLVGFEKWKNGLSRQFTPLPEASDVNEIAKSCCNFSNEQQYILVVGDVYNYETSVSNNLPRIAWAGVISFCENSSTEVLKTSFEESRLIKNIAKIPDDGVYDLKQSGAMWWFYAKGLQSNPKTLTTGYADWRNAYDDFMQGIVVSIGTLLAPNEVNVIIDINSFALLADTKKYLGRMLEKFDLIRNTQVYITILDKNNIDIDMSEYANLKFRHFVADLGNIASYCFSNMSNVGTTKIYIPHISDPIGSRVDEEDLKFFKAHLNLVYDRLVEEQNRATLGEKLAFYRGEPISWAAIADGLYIDREEINKLTNKIKVESNAKKQSIISVAHTPGAGATLLCRVVCWKLRNDYPTIIIKYFDNNVIECLSRINSNSGKPILILIDGDLNRNDIDQMLLTLKSYNIQYIILFTYRQYEYKESQGITEFLGILGTNAGLTFKGMYIDRMKELMEYPPDEIERRSANLNNLATNASLRMFKVPFFYGMYTFEDDFKGVRSYLDGILVAVEEDQNLKRALNYVAIVTYYTSNKAIHYHYVRRLLDQEDKNLKQIITILNAGGRNFVITEDNSFRICHPIMAREFLLKQFGSISSKPFEIACIDLIQTLADLDTQDGGEISYNLNELLMSLFLKREVEMDFAQEKKKNFAQIVLDLQNINLQTELFECLVKVSPMNAHFRQHYGRLLISYNAANLGAPKEQFDMAIELDNENSFHYHARGTMYVKHIKYLLTENQENHFYTMLYDVTATLTELAIADFEKAICYSKEEMLVYPYSSVVSIITYVVKAIYENSGCNTKDEFYHLDDDASNWCKKILEQAITFDTTVFSRYIQFMENRYYKESNRFLTQVNLERDQIRAEIVQHPEDHGLKRMLLREYANDRKKSWDKKKTNRLKEIYDYSNALINSGASDEGLLWMWFNSYVRLEIFSFMNFFGVMETLQNLPENLTANYLLYIAYFCRACGFENQKEDTKRALLYIKKCKHLSKGNSKRTIPRMYYGSNGRPIPITVKMDEEEGLYKFDCHIIGDMENSQSEYLTLDINTRFEAFFVPHATDLKKGQTFDKAVQAVIGFSYDGLRAWKVTKKL